MTSIFEKIQHSYQEKLPFAVYRKPNSDRISSFFLDTDILHYTSNFIESGFVFAPFDSKEKAILFPLTSSNYFVEEIHFSENVLFNSINSSKNSKARNEHILLVEKGIKAIKNNELTKVVLSRKELVELDGFNLAYIYQKLLQSYLNAFVYVWFHPKIGLWMGATPETLLATENNSFTTMSLAGTQPYLNSENVIWGKKELEEQQLVTKFIENQLQGISKNLVVNKTETIKAGNLLHLKTKVTGSFTEKSSLQNIIRALHPTPAVCGFPREEAKSFILEKENYNRAFYTGFLGEINLKNSNIDSKKSHLFVNLRCMSIKKNTISIYVGGGITKDSIAEKEWLETVAKSETVKKVL